MQHGSIKIKIEKERKEFLESIYRRKIYVMKILERLMEEQKKMSKYVPNCSIMDTIELLSSSNGQRIMQEVVKYKTLANTLAKERQELLHRNKMLLNEINKKTIKKLASINALDTSHNIEVDGKSYCIDKDKNVFDQSKCIGRLPRHNHFYNLQQSQKRNVNLNVNNNCF